MIRFMRIIYNDHSRGNYNLNVHTVVTSGASNTCTAAVVADDGVLSVVLTLTARLMYRHFLGLEVFRDFDKEDLVPSPCTEGV